MLKFGYFLIIDFTFVIKIAIIFSNIIDVSSFAFLSVKRALSRNSKNQVVLKLFSYIYRETCAFR